MENLERGVKVNILYGNFNELYCIYSICLLFQVKTISSDSLRSMHSSSGVSSTGSLHLTQESEIAEAEESLPPEQVLRSSRARMTSQTSVTEPPRPGVTLPRPQSFDSENGGVILTLTEPELTSMPEKQDLFLNLGVKQGQSGLTLPSKTVTRSMPDIAALAAVQSQTEMAQQLTSGMHQNLLPRKLTHAELYRMKRQLLLNSTLEAS